MAGGPVTAVKTSSKVTGPSFSRRFTWEVVMYGQMGSPDAGSLPSSNTGVENTYHLDWLSYTCPDGTLVADAIPGCLVGDLCELKCGAMGYLRGMVTHGLKVFYAGREGMGVHVVLSGSAVEDVAAFMGLLDASDLIAWVRSRGYVVTRLDVAINDYRGYITRDRLDAGRADGGVRTHFRRFSRMVSGDLHDKAPEGFTYAFGSRKSQAYVRIYDKRAEQLAKHGVGDQAGELVPDHWMRCEYEFHEEKAHEVGRVWITEGAPALADILNGVLAFVEPEHGVNRSRWRLASWWVALLGTLERRKVKLPVKRRTMAALDKWITQTCSASLAAAFMWSGGDWDYMREKLRVGRERMGSRHWDMLAST